MNTYQKGKNLRGRIAADWSLENRLLSPVSFWDKSAKYSSFFCTDTTRKKKPVSSCLNARLYVSMCFYASSRRLQSLSMTSADLCAMYKPWHVQQTIVSTIMDEFWEEVCFSNRFRNCCFLREKIRERERDRMSLPVSKFRSFNDMSHFSYRAMKKNVKVFNLNR